MTAYTDTLNSGQRLNVGDTLNSPSNTYQLGLELNKSLSIIRLSDGKEIWASGTIDLVSSKLSDGSVKYSAVPDSSTYAVMQTDGNFVLYSSVKAIWHSNTANKPGAILSLGDDGNLVVEHPVSGDVFWQSITPPLDPGLKNSLSLS